MVFMTRAIVRATLRVTQVNSAAHCLDPEPSRHGLLGRGWRVLHTIGEATEGAAVPTYPASSTPPLRCITLSRFGKPSSWCSFGNPK